MTDPFFEVHTIDVRTRQERKAMQNRDLLEKQRLAQRTEGFSRYEIPGDLVQPPQQSDAFIDEAERFKTDSAALEKERLAKLRQKKQQAYLAKRKKQYEKEKAIKQLEEQALEKEQHHLESKQLSAKKNYTSVPYDVVSMQYRDTKEGRFLREKDSQRQYRAAIRARNLYVRANTLNPITGESVEVPQVPEYESTKFDSSTATDNPYSAFKTSSTTRKTSSYSNSNENDSYASSAPSYAKSTYSSSSKSSSTSSSSSSSSFNSNIQKGTMAQYKKVMTQDDNPWQTSSGSYGQYSRHR